MSAGFDFDLFVIGGGSGGVRAARMAARAGALVAIAESDRFGGTCVIRGCVPKKLMVLASDFSGAMEDAAAFGWEVTAGSFDWRRFMAGKNTEVARLEGVYRQGVEKAGGRVFAERAVVVGPHHVRLASGSVFQVKHILVATGGHPMVPEFPGAELADTSDDVFNWPELPGRVVIFGGGYVACEFAGVFKGMGAEVTQVYRGDQVLRGFDRDLRGHLGAAMAARGIGMRMGAMIASIRRNGGALQVSLSDGSVLEADRVLLATGRVPNSVGLGLEEAGVALGARGAVVVDKWSQTIVPSIFAVGDVTDRLALTPVAIREAQAFVDTVFLGRPVAMDHENVPTAVFTRPEIGTVGLSEEVARAKGEVVIYKSAFRPMGSAFAGREDRMLMKLVVDKGSRRVLGCHIAGTAAAEMIQLAGVALGMGATKEDFDRVVAVHPTAAEELVTMREPV